MLSRVGRWPAMLFVLMGLILAVVALFGMARVGRRGILGQAIIGLLVSLGLCAIFVSNFLASMGSHAG